MESEKKFPPELDELPKEALVDIPHKFKRSDLPDDFVEKHEGPTGTSNWLIPNLLMMSSYPFKRDPEEGLDVLNNIFKTGVEVFLCLQKKSELKRFTSYVATAKRINPKSKHYQFEFTDNCAPSKEVSEKILKVAIGHMKKGDKILIHCWGGHGRTGTACSLILATLYPKMKLLEILRRIEATHDTRKECRRSISPQTNDQFDFICDFIGKERDDFSEKEK